MDIATTSGGSDGPDGKRRPTCPCRSASACCIAATRASAVCSSWTCRRWVSRSRSCSRSFHARPPRATAETTATTTKIVRTWRGGRIHAITRMRLRQEYRGSVHPEFGLCHDCVNRRVTVDGRPGRQNRTDSRYPCIGWSVPANVRISHGPRGSGHRWFAKTQSRRCLSEMGPCRLC